MKYLCLVRFDDKDIANFSESDWQQMTRDSMAYDVDLKARGHMVLAAALQSPTSGAIVRTRNGKLSATDGPYAETKEQVAGFILIEARDLNEAITIAGGIPLAKIGSIEVRPTMDISAD